MIVGLREEKDVPREFVAMKRPMQRSWLVLWVVSKKDERSCCDFRACGEENGNSTGDIFNENMYFS